MTGDCNRDAFLPFPPIQRHGVIGDRRTAALVAGDGTVDWYCVPDYDGDSVFGSVLDPDRGGFWRFGPDEPTLGIQRYLEKTAILLTEWDLPSGKLELSDAMPWPDDERRHGEAQRAIIRRIRCLSGVATVRFQLQPRFKFQEMEVQPDDGAGNVSFRSDEQAFTLWTSFPVRKIDSSLSATVQINEGDELWAMFSLSAPAISGHSAFEMTSGALSLLLEETARYWKDWCRDLTVSPDERQQIERSAITVQLLTYAPAGSAVAAVTTSLPERVGGNLNWDYRFAWVRDTSLSLALLALLGKGSEVGRYLDWLSGRKSLVEAPLQVMYHPAGKPELLPIEDRELHGYRGSRPVRFGNRAYTQFQHGSVGFLADCTLIYLENGGIWKDEYWQLIRRIADNTAEVWQRPDCGIWELPEQVHWVESKVMSWVVLDRAISIAEKTGCPGEASRWVPVRDAIHREVLSRGWCERTQSFRQHYGNEEVDGALLLIPVMEFLPADDPKVASTVARIERELTINGFVYRFHPETTPGVHTDLPLGEFEGAFFPVTFWLATTYAKAGRLDQAGEILDHCQRVAGNPGIFSEEVDVRTNQFLGNIPLLFSQVEYARARLAVLHHRSLRGTSLDLP
ncbi:glycoside hydrolase family 15 protein [Geomonas sp.]|uniref:glycoside hydrolase family 15 protein n=1 Tax=Geomonas sp. TaxID=2651584 RepID=UPI002B4A334F|nr:glycoside hydrolase family 15 protein [Geomonas sp.]HJV33688.1 glycoside hydrolase family 15 protein [Geomonas sp.]